MGLGDVKAKMRKDFGIPSEEAEVIVSKASEGGELYGTNADDWYTNRFHPSTVIVDEDDYARMCVDALKILSKTAPTDFGGARQRDLGQLWADMTRGYLGEVAFQKLLSTRWGIASKLDHSVGELSKYLPMDIHEVKTPEDAGFRSPRLRVGVKTTKWNGIWFDIPGDQFNHSDVHVLVKVGTGRDHLLAFFKYISVFKDKVLKEGVRVDAITPIEADKMYAALPSFKPIVAYVCGFVLSSKDYPKMSYTHKMGTKNLTILSWNGPVGPGDIDEIRSRQSLALGAKVTFLNIGGFAHDKMYLFNTGNLLWKDEDWGKLTSGI